VAVDVEIVDLVPRHKLIDVDGAGRLDVNRFEILVSDFDAAAAFADLVPFDDVFGTHGLAGVRVGFLQVDAISGPFVELVEVDPSGRTRGKGEGNPSNWRAGPLRISQGVLARSNA
jgi:hypothetical protein